MTEGVVMLLTGPMQSWGGPVAGIYERPTESRPSLSGVVGIVANALGRHRMDPIDDIAAAAKLAVRVDRPGTLIEDYHTFGNVINAEGNLLKHSIPTRRWYLQDAAFVAVYTPPADGMPAEEVLAALDSPKRPLYLGRRSCPPAEHIPICLTGGRSPDEVLSTASLLREPDAPNLVRHLSDEDYFDIDAGPEEISVLVEISAPDDAGYQAMLRPDAPTTFDPRRMAHMNRRVITKSVHFPIAACAGVGATGVDRLRESLEVSR